jgi:UDP-2,4-diacetamido-2,4,6-trideoxy-beta-L-altropyranose hydrolase
MKILVRCDSGSHIGNGHVMRCVTLCSYIHDHNITFISKDFKNNIIHKIQYETIVIHVDPDVGEHAKSYVNYEDWLGESHQDDFIKVENLINGNFYDLLIVDSYSLDYRWEKLMRFYCKKILVIDDLYNYHDCDYLINYNNTDETLYSHLIPPSCKIFSNLIIREEFYNYKMKYRDFIYNVIVNMGTCPENIKEYVVKTLLKTQKKYLLPFDIILIGFKYEDLQSYNFVSSGTLKELYDECDLCIGSAGVSAYERLVMKVPSINVCVVENQKCNKKVINIYDVKDLEKEIKYYCDNYTEIIKKIKTQTYLNDIMDVIKIIDSQL